jgi:molecular chaperone IbpA
MLLDEDITMTSFDFSPLFRTAIGFDRLTEALESARHAESNGYPPYNIELTGEDQYRISMAVAGFSPDDLEIEVRENKLKVSGARKEDRSEHKYLYQGIANRSFERAYQLADHVRVESAEVKDGLLHIDLVREIPEAMKPRRIEIRGAEKLIEGKADVAA